MTTGYRIDHQDQMYFLTFRVVKWVDVFTREIYAQVIIDSLRYCRENKGMRIYAFVIMSNHLHVNS
jgi:REP element-mobilizing transposase RayT